MRRSSLRFAVVRGLAAGVIALVGLTSAHGARVVTTSNDIGSGLATTVDAPGSCATSGSIGVSDACSGFFYTGASLAEATALGTAFGWGAGSWTQATDSDGAHSYIGGTGTSTAPSFDAGFGPLAPDYNKAYVGLISFPTPVTGSFVVAMSGTWTSCLGNNPDGSCIRPRPASFTAYYLFDDVIFESGTDVRVDINLGERALNQTVTSVSLYQFQASAVPEPSSWAMLIAGLLIVLAQRARRRPLLARQR